MYYIKTTSRYVGTIYMSEFSNQSEKEYAQFAKDFVNNFTQNRDTYSRERLASLVLSLLAKIISLNTFSSQQNIKELFDIEDVFKDV